jgi:hypothetical protein
LNLVQLMERVGDMGSTIIIKVDGERGLGDAGRWTFAVSGGKLSESGPVRVDSPTLEECLTRGLAILKEEGEEWSWIDEVVADQP